MNKILFIYHETNDVIISRLPLLQAAIKAGYQVALAIPNLHKLPVKNYPDITFYELHFNRKSINPWSHLKILFSLKKIIKEFQPDLVQIYRVKLILLGGLVVRWMKVPTAVFLFTGLGYLFNENNWKVRFLKSLTQLGFRYIFKHPKVKVVFQNQDDRQELVDNKVVNLEKTFVINGSGVDLKKFPYVAEPNNSLPVILLLSRMLWDKGIAEYVAAAQLINHAIVRARFLLVGSTDDHGMTSVPLQRLKKLNEDGVVEWQSAINSTEVPALLANANIVCLPSYREGLPRALIEGAACGRALITTDVPGCREVVKHNYNGLLVPAKDANTLAEAFIELINDPAKRHLMGKRSRAMAEQQFSLETIISENLKLYAELLSE